MNFDQSVQFSGLWHIFARDLGRSDQNKSWGTETEQIIIFTLMIIHEGQVEILLHVCIHFESRRKFRSRLKQYCYMYVYTLSQEENFGQYWSNTVTICTVRNSIKSQKFNQIYVWILKIQVKIQKIMRVCIRRLFNMFFERKIYPLQRYRSITALLHIEKIYEFSKSLTRVFVPTKLKCCCNMNF